MLAKTKSLCGVLGLVAIDRIAECFKLSLLSDSTNQSTRVCSTLEQLALGPFITAAEYFANADRSTHSQAKALWSEVAQILVRTTRALSVRILASNNTYRLHTYYNAEVQPEEGAVLALVGVAVYFDEVCRQGHELPEKHAELQL